MTNKIFPPFFIALIAIVFCAAGIFMGITIDKSVQDSRLQAIDNECDADLCAHGRLHSCWHNSQGYRVMFADGHVITVQRDAVARYLFGFTLDERLIARRHVKHYVMPHGTHVRDVDPNPDTPPKPRGDPAPMDLRPKRWIDQKPIGIEPPRTL